MSGSANEAQPFIAFDDSRVSACGERDHADADVLGGGEFDDGIQIFAAGSRFGNDLDQEGTAEGVGNLWCSRGGARGTNSGNSVIVSGCGVSQ